MDTCTVAEVKQEIEQRILFIGERKLKYSASPAREKQKEALLVELHQIASNTKKGESIPPEYRERLSEVLTDLNLVYGISQTDLAKILGKRREHVSSYIRKSTGEKRYFDESMLKKQENKESLLAELRSIKDKKEGKHIPRELRPRLSEVITKLNVAYGESINQISEILGMDRNVVASYMHVYIGPEIKREPPFTKGPNTAKKEWWKKSGRNYKELWSFAQEIAEVYPIKTKGDYEMLAVEYVNYMNIVAPVRDTLLEYISGKMGAMGTMQSRTGYRGAVEIPLAFVQWLSEKKGREITFKDLSLDTPSNPQGINADTADMFAKDWVPDVPNKPGGLPTRSKTSMAHVFANLTKFSKYLDMRERTEKYPFKALKYSMRSKRTDDIDDGVGPVYTTLELDEIFRTIIPATQQGIILFMRLLLQTGARPEQIYSIRCKDLDGKPTTDAYGKTFYIINTRVILSEEKTLRGEEITKKQPTGRSYISERMKKDLDAWCTQRKLAPDDYIFMKTSKDDLRGYMTLAGIRERISYRSHRLTGYKKVGDTWVRDPNLPVLLSHHDPSFYKPYGMRKTWTSVLYNLTGNAEYVIRAGGWEKGSQIPLSHYTELMKPKDAFAVFKKYEIYIDPDVNTSSGKPFREHIKVIQAAKPEGVPEGAITPDDLRKIIGAEMDKLTKQVEEERERRKESEKLLEEIRKRLKI